MARVMFLISRLIHCNGGGLRIRFGCLDCFRQLARRFFETFRHDAQRLEQVGERRGIYLLMPSVIAHVAEDSATQLVLVAAGLGACAIPRLGRVALPAGVRIVGVKPTLQRHVYRLWRAENTRRKALAATIEAFRSAASLVNSAAPQIAAKKRAERVTPKRPSTHRTNNVR
jgi:DNA-binding transcriptional LysR family regulator